MVCRWRVWAAASRGCSGVEAASRCRQATAGGRTARRQPTHMSSRLSSAMRPRLKRTAQAAISSNMPVSCSRPTMIIMPNRRAAAQGGSWGTRGQPAWDGRAAVGKRRACLSRRRRRKHHRSPRTQGRLIQPLNHQRQAGGHVHQQQQSHHQGGANEGTPPAGPNGAGVS